MCEDELLNEYERRVKNETHMVYLKRTLLLSVQ